MQSSALGISNSGGHILKQTIDVTNNLPGENKFKVFFLFFSIKISFKTKPNFLQLKRRTVKLHFVQGTLLSSDTNQRGKKKFNRCTSSENTKLLVGDGGVVSVLYLKLFQ